MHFDRLIVSQVAQFDFTSHDWHIKSISTYPLAHWHILEDVNIWLLIHSEHVWILSKRQVLQFGYKHFLH
jgi:hypothetical protein